MDTELLVGNQIEDGWKLVAELLRAGFDVSVALWVKTTEERLRFFYIGSTSAEPSKIGDAYRTLYACLSKLPDACMDLSEVKLLSAENPIIKDAMAIRDRHPGGSPVRVQGKRLGDLSVEEAYIYPRIAGQLTPAQVLQALVALANRPAATPPRPSVLTLRSGAPLTVLIKGFSLQIPGGLTIHTLDPASKTERQIAGDEVVNIRLQG